MRGKVQNAPGRHRFEMICTFSIRQSVHRLTDKLGGGEE
jgi:hypothetical protein